MDDPKLYAMQNKNQRMIMENVLKEFSSMLSWTKGERVLDIGCGSGDLTRDILLPCLPKDASMVGVDKSANMIKFSTENYAHERVTYKTLDIAVKDIHKYFPEKHFSKIFSFHCIQLIKNQTQLVRNMFTLLRPGGQFLGVLVPVSEMFVAYRRLGQVDRFKQFYKNAEECIPVENFSCEGLRNRLAAQGFNVIHCEWRDSPYTFSSLHDATRMFASINPFIKWMPEDVKSDYLLAYQELLQEPTDFQRVLPSGETQVFNKNIVVFTHRPE